MRFNGSGKYKFSQYYSFYESKMDIKGPKHFPSKLTTTLSTLKVYNFDVANFVETFMLTIEEKLDRDSSLKWEDKKAELRKENELVTIEKN